MRALGVHLVAPWVVAAVEPFLLLLLLVVVELRLWTLTNEGTREATTDCCGRRWCCSAVRRKVPRHVPLDGRCWFGVLLHGKVLLLAHGCFAVALSYCAIFLHPKNGVFSPMLTMYNGYHAGERLFFARFFALPLRTNYQMVPDWVLTCRCCSLLKDSMQKPQSV